MQMSMNDLSPDKRKRQSTIALKTVFNIFDAWGLNNMQQQTLLGLHNTTTFFNWKKRPESVQLSNDGFERISYILGIYKALRILLPDDDIANSWITTPNQNPSFHGDSPLDRMMGGLVVDLAHVRRYLDHERGGGM